LRHLVGNTPLLAIACEVRGRRRMVYAKAEYLNNKKYLSTDLLR
jgi:hypothetical protein